MHVAAPAPAPAACAAAPLSGGTAAAAARAPRQTARSQPPGRLEGQHVGAQLVRASLLPRRSHQLRTTLLGSHAPLCSPRQERKKNLGPYTPHPTRLCPGLDLVAPKDREGLLSYRGRALLRSQLAARRRLTLGLCQRSLGAADRGRDAGGRRPRGGARGAQALAGGHGLGRGRGGGRGGLAAGRRGGGVGGVRALGAGRGLADRVGGALVGGQLRSAGELRRQRGVRCGGGVLSRCWIAGRQAAECVSSRCMCRRPKQRRLAVPLGSLLTDLHPCAQGRALHAHAPWPSATALPPAAAAAPPGCR